MTHIKTAISIDKSLFDQIMTLSRQLRLSRSGVFALAAQEFLKRRRQKQLLDLINEAYSDNQTAEETIMLRGMKGKQRKLIEEYD